MGNCSLYYEFVKFLFIKFYKTRKKDLSDFFAGFLFIDQRIFWFSFISIRTNNKMREQKLETIADYFFMGSLIGILIIIGLITFNLVK